MAFAAVTSLKFILTNLDLKNISPSDLDYELESLSRTQQRLDSECYRGIDRSEIDELEAKIRDAAWKVEDVIELHQISRGVDWEDVEQEIHSFIETVKKLGEEYERALRNSRVAEEDIIEENTAAAAAAADAVSQSHDSSTTVGLSDLSEEIIRGLLDDEVESSVFSIWGMAGIGKTHLARDIYHHPRVVKHFDLRLWVRIGPIHKDIKIILADILAQIKCEPMEVLEGKDEIELKRLLWNSLYEYETYLVVLDDIWSSNVFYGCINGFPVPKKQRKILLTTRLLEVAKVKSYQNLLRSEESFSQKAYEMPFLSDEDSWNLLSQNVFAGEPFPTQLEKAGRKIAEICEGLPLLILTVADILRDLPLTEDFWNKVAEKKTTTFPYACDRIYKVLVLSYDYLPQAYKACFLYMGVFRQGQEIAASKLIRQWFFEGFLGSDQVLNELVSNSIVIVCKHGSSSRVKSCKLHCAYWYVCVKEAREIKLFHVLNKLRDVSMESPRRLSVQNNMLFGLKEVYDSMAASTSLTRSLLFTGEDLKFPVQICFSTMLLMKVLDALAIQFYEFPNEVLNLLHLEYLTLTHNGDVPSSISKLQCLGFLTLRRYHNIIKLVQRDSTNCLPNEIWNLKKLYYLRIMESDQSLTAPDLGHGVVSLPFTLSRLYVNADSCTMGVLRVTSYLIKLGIEVKLQPEGGAETLRCLENTRFVIRLKSLTCVVVNPRMSSQLEAPPNHLSNIPRYLTKLSLNGLGYPWKYTSAIASLPNLKVLKLRCFAFRGPAWEIKSGEFESLQYLLVEDLDVVNWTMEGHFRNLRHLIVRHCYKLKTIPLICHYHMKMIEVDECNLSLVEFVEQIKANFGLKVVVNNSWNF